MKRKSIGFAIVILACVMALFVTACNQEVQVPEEQKPGNNGFGNYLMIDNNDWDGDGLSNEDEINVWHTNPYDKDTDGDGYDDYTEAMTMYICLESSYIP